ncbi:MarR family winged helix-turn-helix transcriptional regulator [Caballeronia sp. J97]|uniref:MarR family winged helix-turn-helix transcriptional regulator n=1 Tax=Caballeronia sp. J97 TaxID=2805429 RepID=UPI002AB06E22|nr:MarR family transcriptional regulator [Caballeronia sp. J97]
MNGKVPKKAASETTAPRPARKAASRPHLTYLIGSLDRILKRRLTDALVPFGLTLAQFTALSVLEARGEASNAQLAERSFITPQSANEVMIAMSSRGWVTREPDPNHGRIVVLRLTDEGRTVVRRCMKAIELIEREMLGDIDAEKAAEIQAHLEEFGRRLRRS